MPNALIFASRYKQIQSRKHLIPKGLPPEGSKWAQESQVPLVLQKVGDLESGVCMWVSPQRSWAQTEYQPLLQLGHRSKVKHNSKGLNLPIQPTPCSQGRRGRGGLVSCMKDPGWLAGCPLGRGGNHHEVRPPCSEGPSEAHCINLLKLP